MSTASFPASLSALPTCRAKSDQPVRLTHSSSELGTTTSAQLNIEQEPLYPPTAMPGVHHGRSQFTPSYTAVSGKGAAIDVADPTETGSRDTEPCRHPEDTLYTEPSGEHKKREQERHMLGLFEQYAAVKSSRNHKYNYEEKYPEDEPGEELGPNARFFNVYLDEAEKYDDDMMRGLSGTLDALLVFAALFSAVVTTFVVDTSHALQPDQALITSSLLFEQVQLLRANGNATAIATISLSHYTPDSLTHSMSDVLVNGLFFASLSLSLVTALISVLAKQWLQAYTSVISGSARDAALIRHLRFMGFEEWKVPQIIGFLPLILHASLGVFISGLVVFLRALYPKLSWIVIGIAGPAFFAYFVSMILPAINIKCPYRITVLYTPIKTFISILQAPLDKVVQQMRQWHRGLHFFHWWRQLYRQFLQVIRYVSNVFGSAIQFFSSKLPSSTLAVPTLKGSELMLVEDYWSRQPVLFDGILWLHDMSSNNSVRQVAACSFAGKDIDPCTKSQLEKVLLSKLHLTLLYAGKETWWRPEPVSSLSHQAATNLAHSFRYHNMLPAEVQDSWFRAACNGWTNTLAFLFHAWKVPVDVTDMEGWTALTWATQRRDYDETNLILNLGAKPNLIRLGCPTHDTVLSMLCRHKMDDGTLEIVNLLLAAGAGINLKGPMDYHQTPLYTAASYGFIGTVKRLLENGANADMMGGPCGTAMHVASEKNHAKTIKVLIKHGANFNKKNEGGETPLGVAIANCRTESAALLREHRALE